ncbi:sialidase family protein [soil metagenome]
MRLFLRPILFAAIPMMFAGSEAYAATKAELVSTKMIWNQAPRNYDSDIVRFKDRWLVVCTESSGEYAQDAVLRVLTSADGVKWESTAEIKSTTQGKGLYDPKLSLMPDGKLMVSAKVVVPNPNSTEPLPRWGGTVTTMAWYSADGVKWGDVDQIGEMNNPFGRTTWHKGTAYTYGHGRICGNSQTVGIYVKEKGKGHEIVYEKTFSGFFPQDAAVVFHGDVAHCLMSRVDDGNTGTVGNAPIGAMLGTSKAPYQKWEWKELDQKLSFPNLIRLPDQRLLAAVAVSDDKSRTVLGEFDLATGKLTELLTLPTNGTCRDVGVTFHDGHVWVSYHGMDDNKMSIHLAKVKLK